MPDLWYCAHGDGYIGPLTGHELLEKLASSATAKDMFVWCDRFPDWKRVGDVEELWTRLRLPPPVPTWKVKWWWVIVALLFFGLAGSQVGRREMIRVSAERRAIRKRKQARL
jgi:hypothetical protein